MDTIFRLKDNVINFLSPSKRRRTIPSTPSKPANPQLLTPKSDVLDARARIKAAIAAKENEGYLVPPHALQSRKRAREDDDEDEVRESTSGLGPDDSISQIEVQESSVASSVDQVKDEQEEEEEEEEDDPEEQSGEDKVAAWQARQAELVVRKGYIEQARATNIHPDALFLTERIHMRSYEELFPKRWMIDFPSLTKELFTDVKERQFIDSNELSSYAGVRALQSLICLGERVSAVRQNDGPTARCISREIQAYIKWSERDGGYYNRRFIPNLVVVTGKPHQSNSRIGNHLLDQFKFLARQHREYLAEPLSDDSEGPKFRRAPPLLYGILVVETLVVIFTYDSSQMNPDILKMHSFKLDGKDSSQEVWECITVACVVVCARNYMMSIKDEFEVEEKEEDPDL